MNINYTQPPPDPQVLFENGKALVGGVGQDLFTTTLLLSAVWGAVSAYQGVMSTGLSVLMAAMGLSLISGVYIFIRKPANVRRVFAVSLGITMPAMIAGMIMVSRSWGLLGGGDGRWLYSAGAVIGMMVSIGTFMKTAVMGYIDLFESREARCYINTKKKVNYLKRNDIDE